MDAWLGAGARGWQVRSEATQERPPKTFRVRKRGARCKGSFGPRPKAQQHRAEQRDRWCLFWSPTNFANKACIAFAPARAMVQCMCTLCDAC